ncbi:MAG: ribosome small subunit-dependent GTPase A [Chlamydiales bacterium]|nr:ribosome small subunit-dependent GTPase A [Chlamydiales bacterium]
MSKFFEEEEEFTRKERKEARKLASKRDRSKYKKTDADQRKRLQKERTERTLSKKEGLLRGRILAITPEGISVQHQESVYLCILRGALKKEVTRAKNLVTVGDFVLFEAEGQRDGSIFHVEERSSVLSRQEHLRRRQKQLIAANIDQVLITVSVVEPRLKPPLVDRYIIATRKGRMDPVIIVNKIDLLEKETEEAVLFKHFVETYQRLGIPVIALSVQTGKGIDQLKEEMKGKASVFSGQSGVGKSSLINAVADLELPIGEVVKRTRKGAHTTTTTHLIPLRFGGWCIDTPGIRSFGVWDLKKEDLDAYFPEIKERSSACKYPDCTHSHEPGCALKAALEREEISPLRFDSYLKLLQEIA